MEALSLTCAIGRQKNPCFRTQAVVSYGGSDQYNVSVLLSEKYLAEDGWSADSALRAQLQLYPLGSRRPCFFDSREPAWVHVFTTPADKQPSLRASFTVLLPLAASLVASGLWCVLDGAACCVTRRGHRW